MPEGLECQLSDGIHIILKELPHSGELEPKNSIRIEGIQTELPCLSYIQQGLSMGREALQTLRTLPLYLLYKIWKWKHLWKLPWHSLFWLSPNGVRGIYSGWRSALWEKLVTRGTLGRLADHTCGRLATAFG
jgi:hypothetical protein